ncbi:methyltransferase family protein [Kribbella amoyensis]|uniref:Methyltransferase family protein n=1 Tax=Kribbella amoyensis TaxID=996641 RepID=A0A561BNE8_9ACTN|nr:class I SAM-dependent methyltransferase [Kribbella amoyensis]TWD80416.1 methyltransferase family protein [Kribbella amoyensis]
MTDPSLLQDIRTSYDTVAASYAELVRGGDAWELPVLGIFANLVPPGARVLDVGCGPGRVTAILRSLGLDASGVDLSPGMIEIARRDHPHVPFEVGTMTALDCPDGDLGGLVAWWSIVHLPREVLPQVLAEFHRVLAPGGRLLIGFHVGDTQRHKDSGYGGHAMSVDVYRWLPDRLTALATAAGFTVEAQLVTDPAGEVPGGRLLFHKSGGGDGTTCATLGA